MKFLPVQKPYFSQNPDLEKRSIILLWAITLIAALVLFQFGTGPIRGFAVTLSIGIVASLFTAIFVTRIVFDYLYVHRRVKELSI